MRAIIDHFDHIVRLTITGGTNIGPVPPGIGLERLRWNGSALVDLMILDPIHVRRSEGRWFLHSIPVPGSQPVSMRWDQRKRLIEDAGTFRILTDQEFADRRQAEETDVQDNQNLREQLTNLVLTTSFTDLEDRINTIWADHTPTQRTFLLQMARIVLYMAKKEVKK